MERRNWTDNETKMAFALYFLLEPNQISKHNADVINLATAINRTPSAVALKLWNISAHDPNRIEAGHVGMKHSNRLDRQIWLEYESRGDELISESLDLLSETTNEQNQKWDSFKQIAAEFSSLPEGKERTARIRQRVNQQYFRSTLLTNYQGACCITGLAVPSLLVASHIKPWAVCDPKTERLAGRNGLLLNALHDRAFDQGYITIDTDYKVRVSRHIKKSQDPLNWLWAYNGAPIQLPKAQKPDMELLEYHNDVIFLK